MDTRHSSQVYGLVLLLFLTLTGCTGDFLQPMAYNDTGLPSYQGQAPYSSSFNEDKYAYLLPQTIHTREKVIVIDPKVYAWGAYEKGHLIKAGIASVGADYCADEGQPCRTHTGTFRIFHMGDQTCMSHTYPIGNPGSLMPYCMFFNGGQSLHGAPDQLMSEKHESHGCVRVRIPDAEWIRYNFARVGTKIIVLPYES